MIEKMGKIGRVKVKEGLVFSIQLFPNNIYWLKEKKVFKWLHPTVLRRMQSKCSTFSQSF